MEGKVIAWHDKHGFGFIQASDEKVYFVHQSDVKTPDKLNVGHLVNFRPQVITGAHNKAVDVYDMGEDPHTLLTSALLRIQSALEYCMLENDPNKQLRLNDVEYIRKYLRENIQ